MKCQKCGSDSRWVDNGPRLQYHYCDRCKIEVEDNSPLPVMGWTEYAPSAHGDTDPAMDHALLNGVIIHTWKKGTGRMLTVKLDAGDVLEVPGMLKWTAPTRGIYSFTIGVSTYQAQRLV